MATSPEPDKDSGRVPGDYWYDKGFAEKYPELPAPGTTAAKAIELLESFGREENQAKIEALEWQVHVQELLDMVGPTRKKALKKDVALRNALTMVQTKLQHEHVMILQKMPPAACQIKTTLCAHPYCMSPSCRTPHGSFRISLEPIANLEMSEVPTKPARIQRKSGGRGEGEHGVTWFCLQCMEGLWNGVGLLQDEHSAFTTAKAASRAEHEQSSPLQESLGHSQASAATTERTASVSSYVDGPDGPVYTKAPVPYTPELASDDDAGEGPSRRSAKQTRAPSALYIELDGTTDEGCAATTLQGPRFGRRGTTPSSSATLPPIMESSEEDGALESSVTGTPYTVLSPADVIDLTAEDDWDRSESSTWSKIEINAVITAMKHLTQYEMPIGDKIWDEASRLLEKVFKLTRSAAAIESLWTQGLREVTGIDERKISSRSSARLTLGEHVRKEEASIDLMAPRSTVSPGFAPVSGTQVEEDDLHTELATSFYSIDPASKRLRQALFSTSPSTHDSGADVAIGQPKIKVQNLDHTKIIGERKEGSHAGAKGRRFNGKPAAGASGDPLVLDGADDDAESVFSLLRDADEEGAGKNGPAASRQPFRMPILSPFQRAYSRIGPEERPHGSEYFRLPPPYQALLLQWKEVIMRAEMLEDERNKAFMEAHDLHWQYDDADDGWLAGIDRYKGSMDVGGLFVELELADIKGKDLSPIMALLDERVLVELRRLRYVDKAYVEPPKKAEMPTRVKITTPIVEFTGASKGAAKPKPKGKKKKGKGKGKARASTTTDDDSAVKAAEAVVTETSGDDEVSGSDDDEDMGEARALY
ncbi:MAG: hypothetical protein M1832_004395 [Thelocarpon impressellum]|nr:MAG: hypothetical protein M1832_004395 [Thelocarpon impressellum]